MHSSASHLVDLCLASVEVVDALGRVDGRVSLVRVPAVARCHLPVLTVSSSHQPS